MVCESQTREQKKRQKTEWQKTTKNFQFCFLRRKIFYVKRNEKKKCVFFLFEISKRDFSLFEISKYIFIKDQRTVKELLQ